MDKNEAIKIVKSHYPANKQMLNEALEFLIPELKESEDEITWLTKYIEEEASSLSMDIRDSEDRIKLKKLQRSLAWLEEKQGEVNKAPKFKVDDWVVYMGTTAKILDLQKHCYIGKDVNDKDFVVSYCNEYEMKKWTIADTRAGDVLVDEDNNIGIYKEIKDKWWQSYIYLGCDNRLYGFSGGLHIQSNTKPATKEQRDQLEKAMADAGWEFDFEKKELKKIENEIEIPFGAKDSELQEVTYYIPKGFYAEIDDDEVVIKKGEKPIAWSEEDDWKLFDILALLRGGENCHYNTPELFDWLKSLRPQKQWKPTEKHISYLEDAIGMYEPT